MNNKDDQTAAGSRALAIRDFLVDHAAEEPRRKAKHRRRWRLASALSGGVILAAATTAGIIVLQPEPIADKTIVLCMSQPTRDSAGDLPGSSATLFHEFDPGYVDDAIELCTLMWQSGALEPSINPTAVPDPEVTYQAPPLTVCVDRDGTAVVVPTSNADVCTGLRLAPVSD